MNEIILFGKKYFIPLRIDFTMFPDEEIKKYARKVKDEFFDRNIKSEIVKQRANFCDDDYPYMPYYLVILNDWFCPAHMVYNSDRVLPENFKSRYPIISAKEVLFGKKYLTENPFVSILEKEE